ncbi:MAG: PepSY domain-containing protein [Gammaproteobacteria bacterium]|nr:PepSY domain-containing protein [Gammaproteobacteria bacterium]
MLLKLVKIFFFAGIFLAAMQPGLAQVSPSIQPGQLDINSNTSPRDVRQAQTSAPRISQRQAIGLARERFTGNVLRISLVGQGNNRRYQIRMENEGKIFTVFVNANTGAVSGG